MNLNTEALKPFVDAYDAAKAALAESEARRESVAATRSALAEQASELAKELVDIERAREKHAIAGMLGEETGAFFTAKQAAGAATRANEARDGAAIAEKALTVASEAVVEARRKVDAARVAFLKAFEAERVVQIEAATKVYLEEIAIPFEAARVLMNKHYPETPASWAHGKDAIHVRADHLGWQLQIAPHHFEGVRRNADAWLDGVIEQVRSGASA